MLRIVTSPLHLSCNFWRASGGKARTSSSICFIAWFLSNKNEDQNYLVLVWSMLWIMWMRVIPFPKIPLITRIYNIWVKDFYSIFTFHSWGKIIPSHDQLTRGQVEPKVINVYACSPNVLSQTSNGHWFLRLMVYKDIRKTLRFCPPPLSQWCNYDRWYYHIMGILATPPKATPPRNKALLTIGFP